MVVVGILGSQSGGKVPSSQLRRMFPPILPMWYDGKIRSLSSRRSRSLFFGNIPETAWRMICNTVINAVNVGRWRHLVRFLDHHILVGCFFESSGKHRVLPVQQLLPFSASHYDLS
jgi:hypothetical protein